MHFDRRGLIVAVKDDGVPVGFAHAGFGPSDDGSQLETAMGTTQVLMVHSGEGSEVGPLADMLLAASEAYLRERGAQVVYAGGINPLNSFYLGLYGGSEIPGVLQTDLPFRQACERAGYKQIDEVCIFQCDLSSFRQPVSRELRLIKRNMNFIERVDPPAGTWWEACVWGALQRDRFELVDKDGRRAAYASFWDMQPISACWGMCAAGLYELYVEPEVRRRGYASHVLGEAIRVLQRRGVTTIEAQTMASNSPALAFYGKLGFTEIDRGFVYRKDGPSQ